MIQEIIRAVHRIVQHQQLRCMLSAVSVSPIKHVASSKLQQFTIHHTFFVPKKNKIGESSASPVKSSAGNGNIVATHYYGQLFGLVIVTLLC